MPSDTATVRIMDYIELSDSEDEEDENAHRKSVTPVPNPSSRRPSGVLKETPRNYPCFNCSRRKSREKRKSCDIEIITIDDDDDELSVLETVPENNVEKSNLSSDSFSVCEIEDSNSSTRRRTDEISDDSNIEVSSENISPTIPEQFKKRRFSNSSADETSSFNESATIFEKRKRRRKSFANKTLPIRTSQRIAVQQQRPLSAEPPKIEPRRRKSRNLYNEMEKILVQQLESYNLLSDAFEFKILNKYTEALRANEHGTFEYTREVIGVPLKKFGKNDLEKHGSDPNMDWPIQSVFKTSDPNVFLVLYEGWTADTSAYRSLDELMETAPKKIKECRRRSKIMKAIEHKTGAVLKPDLEAHRKKPNSAFWILEDLSFFQRKKRQNGKIEKMIFMSSNLNYRNIPRFLCIAENLVDRNSMRPLMTKHAKHINVLRNDFEITLKSQPSSSCTSSTCKCELREHIYKLYMKTAKRLEYSEDCRLHITDDDKEQVLFIVECSDVCGCDSKCPNRTIQNGQRFPLVVYYSDHEKGNVVRAGADIPKGSFICEYTGVVRRPSADLSDIYSLETAVLFQNCVIDAIDKGNVARFMSHSCDPNAIMIEAHSRVEEAQPLIPRVGVFALNDIAMGDEVTVQYYKDSELERVAQNSRAGRIVCHCNTEKCRKYIPKSGNSK